MSYLDATKFCRTIGKLYPSMWSYKIAFTFSKGKGNPSSDHMNIQSYFFVFSSIFLALCFRSDQIRSVSQSCPTLCNPMNRSTPGLPVHHQLPEFTETHVHRVSDAIQPSHPLSSPSPLAPNPSQHLTVEKATLTCAFKISISDQSPKSFPKWHVIKYWTFSI